jgi:RNA polymerase sigma factor (sigma-70 family)
MQAVISGPSGVAQQDEQFRQTVQRERARLLAFIRRRIADATDAEDVLQESFYELLRAYRALQPVEQAGAWLMRVARNRIVDRFRRRAQRTAVEEAADAAGVEGLLPQASDGPEAALLRELLLEELAEALEELPAPQRAVFVAHELDGVSFQQLAERSGVPVNTLLSRKHYALRFLRRRLRAVWEEWLGN